MIQRERCQPWHMAGKSSAGYSELRVLSSALEMVKGMERREEDVTEKYMGYGEKEHFKDQCTEEMSSKPYAFLRLIDMTVRHAWVLGAQLWMVGFDGHWQPDHKSEHSDNCVTILTKINL